MTKALYIHIPFCDQICSYCDFPKVFSKGQDTDAYLTALINEIEIYRKTIPCPEQDSILEINTIYIGGGTPTVLSISQLDRLFSYLHRVINFNLLEEISIEANPESLNDPEKIACLKKHGVSRISLGVQTFNEKHLKTLERTHRNEVVFQVIDLLAKEDFEINLDMIYSIPGQTLAEWEADLDILLKLPITHVSAYSLILEEHTKFYRDFLKDQLELVDNAIEAQMFELVIEKLISAGFEHYEISNFTKGKQSVHNMAYWENKPYIGVGLGAHGHLEISSHERLAKKSEIFPRTKRYENTRSITAYKKALAAGELPILSSGTLTGNEQIEESVFLGLRLMGGISLHALSEKYGTNIYNLYEEKINKLIKLGYVSYTDACRHKILKLTQKGLMMANDVFEAFLL